MNFLCKYFGHKWKYNFSWMPSKRKCQRCGRYETMKFDKTKCPIKEPDEYMLWSEDDYSKAKTNL